MITKESVSINIVIHGFKTNIYAFNLNKCVMFYFIKRTRALHYLCVPNTY